MRPFYFIFSRFFKLFENIYYLINSLNIRNKRAGNNVQAFLGLRSQSCINRTEISGFHLIGVLGISWNDVFRSYIWTRIYGIAVFKEKPSQRKIIERISFLINIIAMCPWNKLDFGGLIYKVFFQHNSDKRRCKKPIAVNRNTVIAVNSAVFKNL